MTGNRFQYVNEIEVAELHQLINTSDPSIELIDIRPQYEANQACIPGALNIPLQDIPLRLSSLATEKTLILYCQAGAKSAQACLYLATQGVHNAINLRGGFDAWKMSGLKVA